MQSNDSTPPKPPAASGTDRAAQRRDLVGFQRTLNLLAAAAVILVALVYLLRQFATVLQQLLVAVLLIYLIMPVHHWLLRHRVSPMFSCIVIVAGILVSFSALGILIGNSFGDLETKLPQYQESLARLVEHYSARIPMLGSMELKPVLQGERKGLEHGTELARTALQTLSNFLSQAFVVLVYMGFILAERVNLYQRIGKAFTAERAVDVQQVIKGINASITQYIVVKTCMGLLAGVLTSAVLLAFGVDYAMLWGILAFLFNYIPYLGSIVASVVPVLLSLVQFEDPLLSLWILGLLILMQNTIGYLIEPRIAGRRLDLSPLVIIVSLAFWGSLWGIVGMILAVPMVVVTKAILEHTLATRPLAKMLSNA